MLDAARTLAHRGPDALGAYAHENTGLGHSRLSIRDLSDTGSQPMVSSCARYVLAYNGEIYNTSELRADLSDVTFRGTSDTEVLLEALIRFGSDALQRINGMFAFAFYDREAKTLLLARDPFGIKPLFFTHGQGDFCFASEIKGLYACGFKRRRLHTAGLNEYLYYGTTLGANTMLDGVHRLLPGHAVQIRTDTGEYNEWTFGATPATWTVGERTFDSIVAETRRRIEQAVARHMVSDVPVAVLLSGGIDSSMITALAARHSGYRLATYTVGYDGVPGGMAELPFARMVAKQYQTDHNELCLGFTDVRDTIVNIVDAHDAPFGDAASIPLFGMAGQIASQAKVVLQGDGGDEVFGGYSRYNWLYHSRGIRLFAPPAKVASILAARSSLAARLCRVLDAFRQGDARTMALLLTEEAMGTNPSRILSPELRNRLELTNPFSRYDAVDAMFADEPLAQRMLYTDTRILLPDYFLEKVDRATMAAGIEARVPFLDASLTQFIMQLPVASKMPRGKRKGLLKAAAIGLVPEAILHRPKQGFTVPYQQWLKGDLGDWLTETLTDCAVHDTQIFDNKSVARELELHRRGQGRNGFLLYKALMLAVWLQRTRVKP